MTETCRKKDFGKLMSFQPFAKWLRVPSTPSCYRRSWDVNYLDVLAGEGDPVAWDEAPPAGEHRVACAACGDVGPRTGKCKERRFITTFVNVKQPWCWLGSRRPRQGWKAST